MSRFEGQVAFVTGAARGQGRAEAVQFASEGADVIAIDACGTFASTAYPGSTTADLEETTRLVEELGRKVFAVQADVRNYEALRRAVIQGVDALGGLDIVVANAGICSTAMSWEIGLEQWKELIDINLTGVFHTLKVALPVMIDQGRGGAVIITSSVAGLKGLPFMAHYSAAKHGLVGLCRSVANEVGQFNIRVNTIHPFGVATAMNNAGTRDLIAQYSTTLGPIFMQSLAGEPVASPEDVAKAVAWLASNEARYITGAQFPLDHGTLIR